MERIKANIAYLWALIKEKQSLCVVGLKGDKTIIVYDKEKNEFCFVSLSLFSDLLGSFVSVFTPLVLLGLMVLVLKSNLSFSNPFLIGIFTILIIGFFCLVLSKGLFRLVSKKSKSGFLKITPITAKDKWDFFFSSELKVKNVLFYILVDLLILSFWIFLLFFLTSMSFIELFLLFVTAIYFFFTVFFLKAFSIRKIARKAYFSLSEKDSFIPSKDDSSLFAEFRRSVVNVTRIKKKASNLFNNKDRNEWYSFTNFLGDLILWQWKLSL